MSKQTDRKELTARLDPDLYEQLRNATYNLRISKQRAITEALRMWLGSNSAIGVEHTSPLERHMPPDMLPVVNWLAAIWDHKGTPEQESLKSSLRALAAAIRETEGKDYSETAR
jgi:hypothetical protein